MHKISICCIVKNEDDLLEWALYHKLIGFDHIYIYDNNDSPIDFDLDFCTIIRYPGAVQQMNAYNNYLNNYKNESKYICMIDADEYVVLHDIDNIKNLLDELPSDLDGLILNWKLFMSEEKKRKEGLVFEKITSYKKNYIKKDGKVLELEYDKNYKTIAKTDKIREIKNPHSFEYKNEDANVYCGDLKTKVEKNKIPVYYLFTEPRISINHYFIKSLEEFEKKCDRGRATCNGKKNYKKEIRHIANLSEGKTKILEWVDETKKEIKKYANNK